jgi:hypothetical protein
MSRKPVEQSAWSVTETETVAPRPPVEVHATVVDATDSRVSTGARRIIKPAVEAGWTVRITYARGPYLGAKGESLRVVDSIMVRGRRAGDHFVACWIDGSFEVAYAGPQGGPAARLGASDLRSALA